MSRDFAITRTMETTVATAIVFNKISGEAENATFTVKGKYAIDDKKLAKLGEKYLNTDTIKFIEIVDVDVVSKLYGITVESFMTHAVELDPKTRKPI